MRPKELLLLVAFFPSTLAVAQTIKPSATPEPGTFCKRYFGSGLSDTATSAKTRIDASDEKEIQESETLRACMMSFPWVRPKDWPAGKDYHGERVGADEMRRIRDSVESYKSSKASLADQWRDALKASQSGKSFHIDQYLALEPPPNKALTDERLDLEKQRANKIISDHFSLLGKYQRSEESVSDEIHLRMQLMEQRHPRDWNQHLLFADFLLLQKLIAEGRYEEADNEAGNLINVRQLHSKVVPWTEADQLTYLSSQNLRNLILLLAANIRVKANLKSMSEELSFFVDYLDSRGGLQNVFGRLKLSDPTKALLQRVANRHWYALDQPSWIRDEELSKLPFFVGASKNGDRYLVVLKGRHTYAFEATDEEDSAVLLMGKKAAAAYTRMIYSDLSDNSSESMTLFAVSRLADTYEVMLAGEEPISLSAEELKSLKSGKPLPASHGLAKAIARIGSAPMVLYTNPLTLRDAMQRNAGDDVAYAIQRSYPQSTIILDPLSDKTKDQISKLNDLGVSRSAKVTALIAEKTFAVKDFRLVQNIEEQLEHNGVKVIRVGDGQIQWAETNGQVVLVITGHIDSQLAAFVRSLGHAGVLDGNYILFNSCRAKLSRQLATEMATLYGATAVFSYDGLITPEQLEPMLLKIPARIEEKGESPFVQWWLNAIKEQNLNGVWTVCWLRFLQDGFMA